jgi:hypothetical protein
MYMNFILGFVKKKISSAKAFRGQIKLGNTALKLCHLNYH